MKVQLQRLNRAMFGLLAAILLFGGGARAEDKIYSHFYKPMEVDEHTFALYRFDEPGSWSTWTNTIYRDVGPNGLDLFPQWTNPGESGVYSNAVSFSNGHYASNTHSTVWNTLTNKLTIEMWIKLKSQVVGNGSARSVLSKNAWAMTGESRPFIFYFQGTGANQIEEVTLKWKVRNNEAMATLVNLGTGWHHVLGSCDVPAKKLLLYVDGQLVGSGDYPVSHIPTNTSEFRIGTCEGDGTMNGSMDELRISNVVRIPTLPLPGTVLLFR